MKESARQLLFVPTTASEDVRLCRVDSNAADVVRVCLKHVNTLQCVVVEDSNLHVVLRGTTISVTTDTHKIFKCNITTHLCTT